MEETLNRILEEVSGLKNEIGNVRTELKGEIGGLRAELIEVKEGQQRLEKKFMGISELHEKLETFIGSQQRILEKLSERSLRHETDIEHLKSLRT